MAARLSRQHDQRTRDKIKTSQIINRLAAHIDGKVEMSSTQIRAAEILLNKTLPNLQAAELNLTGTVTYEQESTEVLLSRVFEFARQGGIGTHSLDS